MLALGASACGGDQAPKAAAPSVSATAPTSEPAASSSAPPAEPYLAVPAGVTLSDQGSQITVGQLATVAWQPRQDTIGVLDLTVSQLQQTTLKKSFTGWKIPEETKTATPYFVRATVANRGESDLSGRSVPLYVVDAAGTLIEATTFASVFKPCRNGIFPAAFGPGASADICLVYFVPDAGTLSGVSFRPTQEFNPITWTGAVEKVKKKTKNNADG